jgi:predicted SAM-dependent methyltransferase
MRDILLFVFSHRTLALIRWDLHFIAVRMKNFLFNKRKGLKQRIGKGTERLFLNLGSGPRGLQDRKWINVDGYKDKNVHYLCDFNRRLPFDSKVFDGIFCEHVLEHFSYENGNKLLSECRRILKDGGIIRIVVPDGKKFMSAYFNDPEYIVKYKECRSGYTMEAVNSWFYQRYEHQCIYDAPYLVHALKAAGFTSASQTEYGKSFINSEDLILDDKKYSWESLYIEAIK